MATEQSALFEPMSKAIKIHKSAAILKLPASEGPIGAHDGYDEDASHGMRTSTSVQIKEETTKVYNLHTKVDGVENKVDSIDDRMKALKPRLRSEPRSRT